LSRPVIGVTGPDRGGLAAWIFSWWAVRRAGGKARWIRPGKPTPVERLDGLIIGGGADVGEPDSFDGEVEIRKLTVSRWLVGVVIWLLRILVRRSRGARDDAARDQLEFRLVEEAKASGIPMLGICRGAQLINRAFGGTLNRDLSDFYEERPNPRSVFPSKDIMVEPGSRLARVLEAEACRVNALHTHAVDEVGEGLRIVAREPNGVVQAIEGVGAPWVLGVQWHPEYLPRSARQRRIFEALVAQARSKSTERDHSPQAHPG
jgi:putative glutamine amidotransferase